MRAAGRDMASGKIFWSSAFITYCAKQRRATEWIYFRNAGKVTEALGASRYREGSCRVRREGDEILIEISLTSVLNKGCGDSTRKPSKLTSQGDLFCKGQEACNLGRAAVFSCVQFSAMEGFLFPKSISPLFPLKFLCLKRQTCKELHSVVWTPCRLKQ